jgi:hypothetical protein
MKTQTSECMHRLVPEFHGADEKHRRQFLLGSNVTKLSRQDSEAKSKRGPCLPQPASKIKERRKRPRYQVQIPVLFRWDSGLVQTDGGFTRDVSLKGFFVNSTVAPPLNARLRCEILMPASVSIAGSVIKAEGQVVRLASGQEGRGFAVMAKFFTHTNPSKMRLQ